MPEKVAKQWFSIASAAEYLGVSIETMRRWSDDGKVECWVTPGGQRRFSLEMLDALLDDKGEGS